MHRHTDQLENQHFSGKFSGSITGVQLTLVGLVLVILVNYPPFFLLATKSPKSFVMGEGQDEKKERGKRCVSRCFVIGPVSTLHKTFPI